MTTTNYHKSNFNKLKNQIDTAEKKKSRTIKLTIALIKQILISSCGNLYGTLSNKNVFKPVIVLLKNIPDHEQKRVEFKTCQ